MPRPFSGEIVFSRNSVWTNGWSHVNESDLNVTDKAIKLLRCICVYLCDLGFGTRFSDMPPKTQATKEKVH